MVNLLCQRQRMFESDMDNINAMATVHLVPAWKWPNGMVRFCSFPFSSRRPTKSWRFCEDFGYVSSRTYLRTIHNCITTGHYLIPHSKLRNELGFAGTKGVPEVWENVRTLKANFLYKIDSNTRTRRHSFLNCTLLSHHRSMYWSYVEF